jgi:4-hydroxyphenylacetate 3-monooxygenase
MSSYNNDGRFTGKMRSGAEFLASIKADGRKVYYDGELIQDVTTHPAFAEGAKTIARLYDIASDPANSDLMTYTSPTSGNAVNRIWQIPYSVADLEARRGAIERWSEESFGYMGRTPDHVAGFFVGYAAEPQVLAKNGDQERADNAVRFYEYMRDNDAYISYTIIPPQIDRSKPAHQQEPPDSYAGIVEERDDGIIISGSQMLGTGTVYSDFVQLSTITPLRPGDENFAISVAIPVWAEGVKIFSRRSYADAANSMFDYPMASRFDETDSLLVYDRVFVPWENIFVYKDLDVARAQWFGGPAHIMGNNQAQIRFVTKLRFMVGIAQRIVEMNGIANLPPVQGTIADLALHAATYEGLLDAQIAKAAPNQNGVYVPDRQIAYAAMVQQSRIYPEIIDIIRELAGGGFIQLPSSVADFDNPEIADVINKFVRSSTMAADERVKFMKLAWDAVGSEFASRHASYEKFYAGAPFIVKSHLYREYDFEKSSQLVDSALAGYDKNGRRDP